MDGRDDSGTAVTVDSAGTHGVGSRAQRREDPHLLTGDTEYVDDVSDPEMTYAALVRSPYGHARIEGIDATAAEERDGVLEVYTAADIADSDAPGSIRVSGSMPGQKSSEFPLLAGEKVRYAGEPVAVVIAEDRYMAHDATDDVAVDYEPLDAVTDHESALDDDAPVVHEEYDDNRNFDWEFDTGDVDAAFEAADHTVELDVANPRVIPNAMEPRGALADYDPGEKELTIRASTQVPHRDRGKISDLIDMPEHRIRVIAADVGGGFGSKGGSPYHEEPLTAWCAVQLERPVKWINTRTGSHQADHHGRDVHSHARLAVDDDGTIRGLYVDAEINLGAYLVWGTTPASNFRHLLSGQYDIPAIGGRVRGAFTNTAPIAPYRGAGRPESVFVLERVVDQAANELGMDPAEFRRRNLIPADAFPYDTATGATYDSGDYERALDTALETLGYEEWRERQAELREEGRYLGIGICGFVENTGSSPGTPETARVKLRKSGEVLAYAGTADHGQGHATAFAQMLGDELGVDPDDVTIREGDTDDLRTGIGTFGSRSIPVGASALSNCASEIRRKARRLAADELEADRRDIEFADGEFRVAGAPERSIGMGEIAELSYTADDLPEDVEGGLESDEFYDPENNAYAFGTHLAVVEVDTETGEISFHEYLAVDDCGVQINPMLVEGQLHGGIAQGIGQALYEEAVYDDSGTLLSGSFMDYAMPKAEQLPAMDVEETETPCPHNPIGAKGVGESGTMGAPPAVVNAVVDALRPLGVDNLAMPLSPETVWQAIDAE